MDVKKLSLGRYLAHTVCLAAPSGALAGYFSGLAAARNDSVLAATVIGLVAGSLMGVGISYRNYKGLIMPMKKVMEDIDRLAEKSGGEGAAKKGTAQDLRRAFGEVVEKTAAFLNSKVAALEEFAGRLSANARQSSAAAAGTASVVGEAAATVDRLAATFREVYEESLNTGAKAAEGKEMLVRADEIIGRMSASSREVVDLIKGLAQKIDGITRITVAITELAEQTNLLALNAAIEAARVGEHGKGFAVVAEEVRRLAEGSARAAREIMEVIGSVEEEAARVVGSTERSAREIGESSGVILEANRTLEEMIDLVAGLSAKVQEVRGAIDQIDKVFREVAATVEEQSAASEEVSSSAVTLSEMSKELGRAVAVFKL
ncbi:MAG: methyl-accepting chemotaxis protein [Desulfotomaculales bacterium]